jgi:hypothetical protein
MRNSVLPERVPANAIEIGDEITGRGAVRRIESDRNGISLCFEHAKPLTLRPQELVSREQRERRIGLERRKTATRRWGDAEFDARA